jgi:hypothetical protein
MRYAFLREETPLIHGREVSMKTRFPRGIAVLFSTASLVVITTSAFASDPINPIGWTSNIQLGAALPGGLYFADIVAYIGKTGPSLSPGLTKVASAINDPAFAWSTPFDFLGGHVEVLGALPELNVNVNPGGPNSSSATGLYNPSAYVGEAWNLGNGFGISEFVGGFFPVNDEITAIGLGGNVWTFSNIVGVAYNNDGWALSGNFFYAHSENDLNTGLHLQPDTFTVDFAGVKHIKNLEFGLVGDVGTDISKTIDNDFGVHPFSEVSLGPLVGYTFGTVTAEVFALLNVEARNQTGGGYDTGVYGRLIVPVWNPPGPAPTLAKY